MNTEQLRTKMEETNQYILDSEVKVLAGTMVDLTGLDKDVSVICQKAVSLPSADASDIQPLMAEMIGNLERLGMALKNFRDDFKK